MADRDRLLDHEYDGIQEYDNRLPNWWLFTLYGAVIFAVVYWLTMHTWRIGLLSNESYEHEMAAAAQKQLEAMKGKELTDDALLLMAQIPANVERGHAVFEQFCIVCHNTDGSGKVGPNLTDAYWLHGGRPLQILHTVTYGVPEKGMAAWGNQLGPARVQDAVTFVLSIKNKNRPGKAPQGELEIAPAPSPSASGGAPSPTTAAAGAPAKAGASVAASASAAPPVPAAKPAAVPPAPKPGGR
ncbi:MAG: cbb3-type cytochrome c oxidase N-terminal domain-containing protein [bacterium]